MKLRGLILGLCAALTLAGCEREPATTGGPAVIRRLTEAQYRTAIADIFGSQIVVASHFDPILRTDGLLAVGAGRTAITGSGFERYHALARSIATQVVAPENREVLLECAPANAATADDACAKTILKRVGRLLYRRPLSSEEIDGSAAIARDATATRGDFHAGLAYALQSMMESPDFLFIVENPEGDTLDAFSRATRLSFLLWNATPDDVLLTAAEKGDLDQKSGLTKQVDRMIASPRFKDGVRAFFSDMLSLDDVANMQKDTVLYPAFTLVAATDSREQVLRTLTDLLVTKNGDYREIFTTRSTFISTALGLVYRLPVTNPGGWSKIDFAADDPRAGIQTQLSFAGLHSHPGKSSPTLRGKAIRELLMCQKVPDPPGTVSFDQFNDPNSPNRTARQRLAAHATDSACAGCHKLTDPIGLAMETFDGAGQLRETENGERIDTTGELNGKPYANAADLGRLLHDDPAATSCVVNRAYSYAVGRTIVSGEKALIDALEKAFAADKYRFPALIRRIALSDAFLRVSAAPPTTPGREAKL